jgi:hypothetical protein
VAYPWGSQNPPHHEPVPEIVNNLYSIIYVYFLPEWALKNNDNNNNMKQLNINRTIEVNIKEVLDELAKIKRKIHIVL